jgi:hypothetical protein
LTIHDSDGGENRRWFLDQWHWHCYCSL